MFLGSNLVLYWFLMIQYGCWTKNSGKTPQIIHLFIGFSIIFTIHFGGFPPIFGNTHISSFSWFNWPLTQLFGWIIGNADESWRSLIWYLNVFCGTSPSDSTGFYQMWEIWFIHSERFCNTSPHCVIFSKINSGLFPWGNCGEREQEKYIGLCIIIDL